MWQSVVAVPGFSRDKARICMYMKHHSWHRNISATFTSPCIPLRWHAALLLEQRSSFRLGVRLRCLTCVMVSIMKYPWIAKNVVGSGHGSVKGWCELNYIFFPLRPMQTTFLKTNSGYKTIYKQLPYTTEDASFLVVTVYKLQSQTYIAVS